MKFLAKFRQRNVVKMGSKLKSDYEKPRYKTYDYEIQITKRIQRHSVSNTNLQKIKIRSRKIRLHKFKRETEFLNIQRLFLVFQEYALNNPQTIIHITRV